MGKKCRKNDLCIGFTFDHGAKENGGGCMLAPPCQFFGSITYDYYVKDFKCPKKARVKAYKKPKPVDAYASGTKAHVLDTIKILKKAKGHHTKELNKVMHHIMAKDFQTVEKKEKKTEELECGKCVAGFVKAGGCHRYKVEKKDPSFLIPKGCSACGKACIAACGVKGYTKKVVSSTKAKKVLAKKLKKALKKSVTHTKVSKKEVIKKSFQELKTEAKRDAKEVIDTKKAIKEGKVRAELNKAAKAVTPWAKKQLEANKEKSKMAEDTFTEVVDKA